MADGIEIKVKVTGLKEAQRKLYAYSQQLGDKVVMAALLDVARQVRNKAKANAPSRTGRLRRAIVVKRSKIHSARRSRTMLGVYLTIRRGKGRSDPKDGFYGRWVERGWNVRGPNRTGGRGKGRKTLPGKRDIPGKLFMNRAFNAAKPGLPAAFARRVETGANQIANRLGIK